jgi:hypothetical protein
MIHSNGGGGTVTGRSRADAVVRGFGDFRRRWGRSVTLWLSQANGRAGKTVLAVRLGPRSTRRQLRPLARAVIANYLRGSAGGPAGAARWDGLLAAWPRPVAQTLTTPLMATLARTLYNPRPGEDDVDGAGRDQATGRGGGDRDVSI